MNQAELIPNSVPQIVEKIWEMYPRKVVKRLGVQAILKAIKRHGEQTVFERTRLHAPSLWQKKALGRTAFIPHPTTFFNQDRFMDEPEEVYVDPKGRDKEIRLLTRELETLRNDIDHAKGMMAGERKEKILATLLKRKREVESKRLQLMEED